MWSVQLPAVMTDILHLYTCTEDERTLTTQVVMPTPTTGGSTGSPRTITTSTMIDASNSPQSVTATSSPEHVATTSEGQLIMNRVLPPHCQQCWYLAVVPYSSLLLCSPEHHGRHTTVQFQKWIISVSLSSLLLIPSFSIYIHWRSCSLAAYQSHSQTSKWDALSAQVQINIQSYVQ